MTQATKAVLKFSAKLTEAPEYQGKEGKRYNNILKMKSDEYDPPVTLVVNSDRVLGKIGTVIQVECEARSYSRTNQGETYYSTTLYA